jgi:integrase
MLKRRGADAGITDLHPHAFRHTWAHAFRHTWAHAFRAAGGNEGDLMLLGGWRSRAMLDRYGKAAAAAWAGDSNLQPPGLGSRSGGCRFSDLRVAQTSADR